MSKHVINIMPCNGSHLELADPESHTTDGLRGLRGGFGEDEDFDLAAQAPVAVPEPEPEPEPEPPELPLEPQVDPDPKLTRRRQQLMELLIPPDTEDPISDDEGMQHCPWLASHSQHQGRGSR